MFDILTTGFKDAALKLKGQTRLTETNIASSLDAVRRSLLDADVELGVVKQFLANVREKALNSVVTLKSKTSGMEVSAGDHFVQICHDEIVALLGEANASPTKQILIENPKGPTVILLVGLQGSGKTTHAAKLAHYLKTRLHKKPLLVAADVYRPAAREQLKVMGERISVPVFTLETNNAVEIAVQGCALARADFNDTVIIDTAGRLSIDESLMLELENIKAAVMPQNILLVIDSMIGQDAVKTAANFDKRLHITGSILTKLDGDTRGGAALSVKKVTGKEILFLGTGEGIDKLEEMRPEGLAGRILGMGDIVGLMDDFSRVITEEQVMSQNQRVTQGIFDFEDFLEMTGTMQKMGSIKDIIAKTPLASQINSADLSKINDNEITRMAAIVHSMSKQERKNPDLLLYKSPGGRSRVARIARGSARSEKDVRDLVDKFMQMRQMVQLMSGAFSGDGGLLSKIPGLGGLNKLANIAKAAKQMGGAGLGGLGGMPGLGDMLGGAMGGGGKLSTADMAEINRMRKRKKEEKQKKRK